MATRSVRLCAGTSTTSAVVTVYTCPAGKTALLKDVRVYANGAVGRAVILVQSGSTDVSIVDEALSATQVVSRQGFIVLEPGDTIRVYSSTSTFNFWCSGAELEGVAP